MKKITLAALAGLAFAISPAIAQTEEVQDGGVTATKAIEAAPAAGVQVSPEGKDANENSNAPAEGSWASLDDTTRFLSIMGTADGFSAAGAGSPCFPGKDTSTLDSELKAAGFDAKAPADLAFALAQISSPAEKCAKVPQRGYTSDLLKSMPDAHLATYLTGAVRGYAQMKTCAPENHAYAAAAIAAEIFAAKTVVAPHEIIAAALKDGCAQPAS